MSYADANPGYRLETEDQCRNWVLELVDSALKSRALCDVVIPGDRATTVREQQKNYRWFLVKHGSALGALMACHRAGLISDVLYEAMRQKIVKMRVPTLVGVSSPATGGLIR